jgi:hypothetical protein
VTVEAPPPRETAPESAVYAETLTRETRWQPDDAVASLAEHLATTLMHPAIVDLLIYGSLAGGTPTGFSDVDAVLVIEDWAAGDRATLRELRPLVLAAQRAVQAYQPMQHHGFEVATRNLLGRVDEALGLPREALLGAMSLYGRRIDAGFSGNGLDPARRLKALVTQLSLLPAWPRHPWRVHRAVSMFELLPALYLQATDVAVCKARSFTIARGHFGDAWWPYDVLEQVREAWPRRRRLSVELSSAAARNPWVVVAAWTRLPSAWPSAIQPLLTPRSLEALQDLAAQMTATAG